MLKKTSGPEWLKKTEPRFQQSNYSEAVDCTTPAFPKKRQDWKKKSKKKKMQKVGNSVRFPTKRKNPQTPQIKPHYSSLKSLFSPKQHACFLLLQTFENLAPCPKIVGKRKSLTPQKKKKKKKNEQSRSASSVNHQKKSIFGEVLCTMGSGEHKQELSLQIIWTLQQLLKFNSIRKRNIENLLNFVCTHGKNYLSVRPETVLSRHSIYCKGPLGWVCQKAGGVRTSFSEKVFKFCPGRFPIAWWTLEPRWWCRCGAGNLRRELSGARWGTTSPFQHSATAAAFGSSASWTQP